MLLGAYVAWSLYPAADVRSSLQRFGELASFEVLNQTPLRTYAWQLQTSRRHSFSSYSSFVSAWRSSCAVGALVALMQLILRVHRHLHKAPRTPSDDEISVTWTVAEPHMTPTQVTSLKDIYQTLLYKTFFTYVFILCSTCKQSSLYWVIKPHYRHRFRLKQNVYHCELGLCVRISRCYISQLWCFLLQQHWHNLATILWLLPSVWYVRCVFVGQKTWCYKAQPVCAGLKAQIIFTF